MPRRRHIKRQKVVMPISGKALSFKVNPAKLVKAVKQAIKKGAKKTYKIGI